MQRLSIFLSHSSRDKAFVRRINSDLKSGGFDTWIDEDNIPYAASISEEIQNGLTKADVIFLFLSEAAVRSKWVSTEWQSQFFKQVSGGKTMVVPVLVDDCELPEFLQDRKYIDFRKKSEYGKSLASALDFLQSLKVERYGAKKNFDSTLGIKSHVMEILDDLEGEAIQLPQVRRIPIVKTLKGVKRSGKLIRLQGFKPEIKVRSVYDHVISLAHISECFIPCLDLDFSAGDRRDLLLLIAYHDINEVILGDIPAYTSLSRSKRASIRVYAEQRFKTVPPNELERIANDFVWLFLSEQHRQAFRAVMDLSGDAQSKVFRIFQALDKMDPIIAVWRYLHHYRGMLGDTPKLFNSKMKDFYENPDVASLLRDQKISTSLIDTLSFLQDREHSWNYYENANYFDEMTHDFLSIPPKVLKKAIEGVPLFCDD